MTAIPVWNLGYRLSPAGLELVWRGPSNDGPERLIHADRPLDDDVLEALVALG